MCVMGGTKHRRHGLLGQPTGGPQMDFALTAEQEELAKSERLWLSRHDPIAGARQGLRSGKTKLDTAAVAHAFDSGLLALLTPELGGTHLDLAVLSEAHGYAASSLPLADLAI